ncbi:MAG: potassium-transporting ATPase subunit C [Nitrososphaerota archaeon]|nr:potassium-transporting ATPase subunit C [Nitrososphaerota archaeon]MDG6978796.1 potassium-transporting ATPase subunit C [Nitrososphaerota archaeon]MDG7005971.1 potassium-transporting ATPase subunit C [Nitrososphaerota archaeon]MDG7021118.1 potassium-transporting ATPase subunit C [Nitrososphaerota archaeon]
MEAKPKSSHARQVVAVALLSLVVCGILFPLVVTGVAQAVFPYQANGELQRLGGRTVGSIVAVNSTDYTLPVFFHLRNDTASGFDPDLTLTDALSQVPGISAATGIPGSALRALVQDDVQGVWWVFGSPYVNAQELNIQLVRDYPQVYAAYG